MTISATGALLFQLSHLYARINNLVTAGLNVLAALARAGAAWLGFPPQFWQALRY